MQRSKQTVLTGKVRSFGVLVFGLLAVTATTAGLGIWHHHYELAHQTAPTVTHATIKKNQPQTAELPQTTLGQTTTSSAPSKNTPAARSIPQTSPATTSAAPSPQAPSQPNPATISASLTINDSPKGTVTLPPNSNNCDVLTQALKTGQINSLDMRYSTQYGTYAIYAIDGIGDSNAVWWTYKVNGKSPPYGCSQQAVHNGDSITWQYVKQ